MSRFGYPGGVEPSFVNPEAAMHETLHDSPGSAVPSPPSAMPGGDLLAYLDDLARASPEIVVKLIVQSLESGGLRPPRLARI